MQKPRKPVLVAAVLLLAAALLGLALLYARLPPVEARMLPEADAIVFLSLRPLRLASHFDRSPVARSLAYQAFVDQTGIVPERDLDSVAFALQRMIDPSGPNGPAAFTEVFSGHFDRKRFESYLARQASATETYAGQTIYLIPSEGRTFRVTSLTGGRVGASNAPTPEQIHSLIDRSRATPWHGPALLAERYAEVPALSSGWAIGQVLLPFASPRRAGTASQNRVSAFGFELPLSSDANYVASLRFQGSVRVRLEELDMPSGAPAHTAANLYDLLGILKSLKVLTGDAQIRSVIDSIHIEEAPDRLAISTSVPISSLLALNPH